MNRRKFIKSASAMSVFALGTTLIPEIFKNVNSVTLPSLDGDLDIYLGSDFSVIGKANAQNYYNYSYQQMAPYQRMYEMQRAYALWQAKLAQFRTQQYLWIRQQHINAVLAQMQQYSNQYNISAPRPWDYIESIYGFAVKNGRPTLFGANSESKPVEITKTVQGAGAVFEKVGDYFNENVQQNAAGPQSNEVPALISLPNGNSLKGNAYKTKYGALGVTEQVVQAKDGTTGQLAKFKLGSDGEQYLIV
jgi:hypothetical protein